jgi:hypothetical protein
VIQLATQAEKGGKVGIDCPLGWPTAFAEFLNTHRFGNPGVASWQPLAYRRTDEHVRAFAGLALLSVSTDRIGLTAMRAATLQALLAQQGHDVHRSGTGLIVEVHPAAGLKL